MLTKLRNNFIAGLVAIIPVLVTVWLTKIVINTINSWFIVPVARIFGIYFPGWSVEYLIGIGIFILLVGLVSLIGWAAKNIIIRRAIIFGESLFVRLPMVSKIYTVVKEISRAFLGQRRGIFEKAILLEYPRKGVYSIGFVTSKNRGKMKESLNKEALNVFVPTAPNPTSGIFLIVPKEEVIELDMSVEEGMKLVISGGAVGK